MILIVGGAGYIGSHVNKLLTINGYKTVVLDNLSTGHKEFARWGEFEFGDLGDVVMVRNVFAKYPISAVMHFAAHAYVEESVCNPHKYYFNNVANTLNLLGVMKDVGVSKLIFSSSCATYGTPEKMPISEENKSSPINPYGRSKLMVEEILHDYSDAYHLKYVSLRYFNAAGADIDAEIGEWHEPEPHLMPRMLDVAAGKRASLKVYGADYQTIDGTCVRDYVHVEDIARGHLLALRYLQNCGESVVLNLGTGRGYSIRQIVDVLQKIAGCLIPCDVANRRIGDPAILVADYSKATRLLGWQPLKTLEEIVASAWRWHKILHRISI